MRRFVAIIWSSLKMALQEFRSNKLRTFLSLFGVTIGIFCIISVLSTVNSLERKVQSDLKALGNNTIYIDKWVYDGGDEYPWWKYMKRPTPKYEEMRALKGKVPSAANVAFVTELNSTIEYEQDQLTGVTYYGYSEDFPNIQKVDIIQGRTLLQSDFDQNVNAILVGYEVAEKLFGKAENAVGKQVALKGGRGATIVGLIKKQGKSMIGGWEFDNSIHMVRGQLKQLNPEEWSSPKIMVQAKPGVSTAMVIDELEGAMRSLRKLKPTQEDDFALNDMNAFSSFTDTIFGNINKGGWAIAALSLVVGMFGVANIMFVTVRERTSQIGLKKAIGAKRSTILTEFLLESAFLCILGGMIGLVLVFILTKIASSMIGFPLFISGDIMLLAIGICILVGVLAGIIPASIASKMNPVVAIRSK
ncbi:MAG: FtsX-like permease family protein [Chitinophagaceae bacterium]|nr:MAG: FtsX-like permease family protein [Chitinophagaceae bacterium]